MRRERSTAPDARRLLGVLANAEARTVFAQIVVNGTPGESLPPARLGRALGLLDGAGLIETVEGQGSVKYRIRDHVFLDALASLPTVPRPSGVERFLTPDGRIDRYPSRESDRRKLLDWIAARILDTNERVAERAVNERLARFTEDVPKLRRELIDSGTVDRTPDGSAYWLTAEATVVGAGGQAYPER